MENTYDETNSISKEVKRYYVSNFRIFLSIILNLVIFIIFMYIVLKYFLFNNMIKINFFNVNIIYYFILFFLPFLFLKKSLSLIRYINNYIEFDKNSLKAKIGSRKYNILDNQINNIVIKEKTNSNNIKKYFIKIYYKDEEKYVLKLCVKNLFKKQDQEEIKKFIEEKNNNLFNKKENS